MRRIIIVLLFSLPAVLRAQQPVTPGQIGAAPLTRDAEQKSRNNQLSYGVSYSESFDDNVVDPISGGTAHSFISSVRPNIALTIDRSRFQLAAHYVPGFSYFQNSPISNEFSQATGVDFQYAFSKRLSLSAHQSYIATSNPFDNVRANTELPGFGVIDHPTSASLGTNLDTKSEQLVSDLTYRVTRYTSVGAGGSFGSTKQSSQERNINGATSSRFWSGRGFVSHQFGPRHSVGIQYTAQSFTADGPFASEALGHEVIGFWNISWTRSFQLGFYGGPNRLHIDQGATLGQGLTVPHTAVSGGASLTWQGEYSGMSVNFAQRAGNTGVSGGGVVNIRSASLSLQRQLTKVWTTNVFASYSSESPYLSSAVPTVSDSVSYGTSVNRAFGQRLTLGISAMRQQFIGTIPILFSQRSHDVVTGSISYRASRPVGR